MIENDVNRYYKELVPSAEALNKTLAAVARQHNISTARFKLIMRCACSAAACFLLALAINSVVAVQNPQIALNTATVLGSGSGYMIAAFVFVLLTVVFLVLYLKKLKDFL